jgi:CubicO group peptidase (beta-lactamase class C family)
MTPLNENHQKEIDDLTDKGVKENVYPGCVLLVSVKGEVEYFRERGYLSLAPASVPMKKDTIFDLASLTKPLATTLVLMALAGKGDLDLDQPLSSIIKDYDLMDKSGITPRMLLNHCSGLIDWMPFYLKLVNYGPENRKRILREMIVREPLKYPSGRIALYSDLGFMMLEWIVEAVTGLNMDRYLINNFYGPLSLKNTFLNRANAPFDRNSIAATEECPWRKRIIQGEVHDENAFAAGGFSGHAGLFSTAGDVLTLAEMLMDHYHERRSDLLDPKIVMSFFKRQDIVSDSTWALGWDTPSCEGSSSGRYFSQSSAGHLGFTGTSLWMDLKREIIVIFLSNRVHPTRDNIRIRGFRPVLHDLVMQVCALESL